MSQNQRFSKLIVLVTFLLSQHSNAHGTFQADI